MDEGNITPLPRSLPITAVVLIVLGFIAQPIVNNAFTPQQLSRNALLGGIPFILFFAAITLLFMSGAWYFSNRINFRVKGKTYRLVEQIIIGSIVVGVIGMFQPWVFVFFRYGFYLLSLATLAFIVWSHVAPLPDEDDISEM